MVKQVFKYKTNARRDYPDSRDWIYRPFLGALKPEVPAPSDLMILNQHSEGACTGFALAGSINRLYQAQNSSKEASARMLYEMAKRHDEWPGEEYEGSSLRGAILGWKNMGVCSEKMWPYRVNSSERGDLTVERAKDARNSTIGAYFRLSPVISDYHAAITESGVIAVSAKVHKGWKTAGKKIVQNDRSIGGHAFVVIGYNAKGFLVQNSWGKQWGVKGVSEWSYEDWVENVMDAWVFRLAIPTPQIFGKVPKRSVLLKDSSTGETSVTIQDKVYRDEIAGHFVHVDDGQFAVQDRFWSTEHDVRQTAKLIRDSKKYKHILFYAHGGLNSPKNSAIRIRAMKEVFKKNGIYPYHIMYDTGLIEELRDLIIGKGNKAQDRVGGLSDWTDKLLENLLRRPGRLIWNEMKEDARDAFSTNGAGTDSLKIFLEELRKPANVIPRKIHLAGHSTGAVLIGHMLKALLRHDVEIESCHLMAPACSIEFYKDHYIPVLDTSGRLKLKALNIFNLVDRLERDDNVAYLYRKSLLYLVSNAFEKEKEETLLGLEKFKREIPITEVSPRIIYSNGTSSSKSKSTSHGGFDNDVDTMNSILKGIMGNQRIKQKFTTEILDY